MDAAEAAALHARLVEDVRSRPSARVVRAADDVEGAYVRLVEALG